MRRIIVCKFGGTSVANAGQVRKLESIVSDPRRQFLVVSAPGKDSGREHKITDMLYNVYFNSHTGDSRRTDFKEIGLPNSEILPIIRKAYTGIAEGFGMGTNIVDEFMEALGQMAAPGSSATLDDIASRGENFNARLIARHLGAEFVDAKDLIAFSGDKPDLEKSYHQIRQVLGGKTGKVVIPGFYGMDENGKIRLLPRGGSDLTGAIIAAALNASAYENWTDQNGILCCDPSVVSSPIGISLMTYDELRELTLKGFGIFQEEAMAPLMDREIPIHIKNTNNPEHPGTVVTAEPIRGIAGKKDCCCITIEKLGISIEIGFGEKILHIISGYGWSYDYSPSGTDSISIVLEQDQLRGYESEFVSKLHQELNPRRVGIQHNLAVVSVVGEGLRYAAASIKGCLKEENIEWLALDQTPTMRSVIVTLKNEDYERAVQALYSRLIGG